MSGEFLDVRGAALCLGGYLYAAPESPVDVSITATATAVEAA